jgi:hypothetical protein
MVGLVGALAGGIGLVLLVKLTLPDLALYSAAPWDFLVMLRVLPMACFLAIGLVQIVWWTADFARMNLGLVVPALVLQLLSILVSCFVVAVRLSPAGQGQGAIVELLLIPATGLVVLGFMLLLVGRVSASWRVAAA